MTPDVFEPRALTVISTVAKHSLPQKPNVQRHQRDQERKAESGGDCEVQCQFTFQQQSAQSFRQVMSGLNKATVFSQGTSGKGK